MARKYVPSGRPNGGNRPGSGRPAGTKNALALGEVAAVKAAGLRVPESATQAQRELADRALQRIAAVMEEKVGAFASTSVLKAAAHLREEICGAVKQKVEHTFDGQTDEQLQAKLAAILAKASDEFPGGAGQPAKAASGPEGDDAALGPKGGSP